MKLPCLSLGGPQIKLQCVCVCVCVRVCVLSEGVYNTHYVSSPYTVSISLSVHSDPREYCVNTIHASEPSSVCVCERVNVYFLQACCPNVRCN